MHAVGKCKGITSGRDGRDCLWKTVKGNSENSIQLGATTDKISETFVA